MLVSSSNHFYFNTQAVPVTAKGTSTVRGIQASRQGGDRDADTTSSLGRDDHKTTPSPISTTLQVLTDNERKIIEQLKSRDREVRAHEQAHLSAAGSVAVGGASFSFETGPDGRRYAVGGEVAIDISPVEGNPQATIEKAKRIQKAAMAPAEPSAADRQIAAQAATMALEAQVELADKRTDEADNEEYSSLGSAPEQAVDPEDADSIGKTESHCEICGGSHSASSHSDSMRQKIEAVFITNDLAGPHFLHVA